MEKKLKTNTTMRAALEKNARLRKCPRNFIDETGSWSETARTYFLGTRLRHKQFTLSARYSPNKFGKS